MGNTNDNESWKKSQVPRYLDSSEPYFLISTKTDKTNEPFH